MTKAFGKAVEAMTKLGKSLRLWPSRKSHRSYDQLYAKSFRLLQDQCLKPLWVKGESNMTCQFPDQFPVWEKDVFYKDSSCKVPYSKFFKFGNFLDGESYPRRETKHDRNVKAFGCCLNHLVSVHETIRTPTPRGCIPRSNAQGHASHQENVDIALRHYED